MRRLLLYNWAHAAIGMPSLRTLLIQPMIAPVQEGLARTNKPPALRDICQRATFRSSTNLSTLSAGESCVIPFPFVSVSSTLFGDYVWSGMALFEGCEVCGSIGV